MSKQLLRVGASILLLAAMAVWVATGAHVGWTQTSKSVPRVDEVTGLTGYDLQRTFVAGFDFLGAALLGSGILVGASFLCRNKPPQTSS